jgi:hypothetical protein
MKRRAFLKKAGIAAAGTVLAGCELLKAVTEEPTATLLPTGTPAPTGTIAPTETPTPEVTPISDLGYAGDPQELDELLKNFENKRQYDYIVGWYKYWSGDNNGPFDSNIIDLHYSFKPDANDQAKGVFVIESGAYPNEMILPPAYSWENKNPPPTMSGNYDIPPGNGPLMISYSITAETASASGIPEGAAVVFRGGQWTAEVDGKAVGKINKEGMWEKVEEIVLDQAKYIQDIQIVPENMQVTFATAENTSMQEVLGRTDLVVAYSKNLNMVVAVDPNNNLPMGVFNEGQTNISGVDVKGWINVFGTDKIILITSSPDKTKYDLLDKSGNSQSVEKAARELELAFRACVGISIMEQNKDLIAITPSGMGDIENYAKGSDFIKQNIENLPDQDVSFSNSVRMIGLDGWSVVLVYDPGGTPKNVNQKGKVVYYVFGKQIPPVEGMQVITTVVGPILSLFSEPYFLDNPSGPHRFNAAIEKASGTLFVKPGVFRIEIDSVK